MIYWWIVFELSLRNEKTSRRKAFRTNFAAIRAAHDLTIFRA